MLSYYSVFFFSLLDQKDVLSGITILKSNPKDKNTCALKAISRLIKMKDAHTINLILNSILIKYTRDQVWAMYLDIFINTGRDLESLEFLVSSGFISGLLKIQFLDQAFVNKDNTVAMMFLDKHQKDADDFWSYTLREAITHNNPELVAYLLSKEKRFSDDLIIHSIRRGAANRKLDLLEVFLANCKLTNKIRIEIFNGAILNQALDVVEMMFEGDSLDVSEKQQLTCFAALTANYVSFEKCLALYKPDLEGTAKNMNVIKSRADEKLETILMSYQVTLVEPKT